MQETNKPKFKRGQLVMLKNAEDLILENSNLIYQITEGYANVRGMANAQVTIYKVLGERQLHTNGAPVFWYEVGQHSRNIVEIPETFIKEVVKEQQDEQHTEEQEGHEVLSLDDLSAKVEDFINASKIIDVSDLLFNIMGKAMMKYPNDITVALQFGKDKKGRLYKATSGLRDLTYNTFTLFIEPAEPGVSGIIYENLWKIDKDLEERTEKEELQISLFKDVLKDLNPYNIGTRGYRDLLSSIYKECFRNGVETPERIQKLTHILVIARSGYQSYSNGNLSLDEISTLQTETYRKKNADYGDSFKQSMDEDGILVAKIRIGDKIRRIESLLKKGGQGLVKDERLQDTFLDLANYCVMTILWLKGRNE